MVSQIVILLFNYPNNLFVINFPGNSPLLNTLSFLSYLTTSSWSYQYSFSNSLIAFFAFFKFSLSSQVSDFTVNPFQYTKNLSLSLTRYLFKILFTSYSSSPSIITGASCSFLCPFTYSTYFHILLTLTIGYILTVLGSSNSITFNDIIFLIL